ncbi:MAG: histidine kinase dimerization/phospho-acceptor domain-containing protein, partial [Acidithiobacillales bacterium]
MRRILVPVLAGLVLGALFAALLDRTLDGAVAERTRRELENRLLPLGAEFANDLASGASPYEKVRAVARQTGSRVTLIAADGRVLADSEVDPERLAGVENHGNRPEVVEARRSGFGFYRRTSATVEIPFVYVARRIGTESAPLGYVRLAMSQHELDAQEAPFRRTTDRVSVGAGLLVAALFLAVRQRQRRELSRVTEGITEASEGRAPALPRAASEGTAEVFAALTRFARLVTAEREGTQKMRLLARTVFDQVPAGLIVVDAALDLLDANPAALALFRAPAGVPRRALLDLVREPAIHRLFEAGVSPTGEASTSIAETVRFGGESAPERILEVTVRPVPHAARQGEPAAVGVVRDVTEHEQTEMMRRRFVSDVSHELRTPIAAIRAAVETLSAEPALPPDMARLLDILSRQSSQVQDLVSDLTDLSQIESGGVSLQAVPVPVKALLDS